MKIYCDNPIVTSYTSKRLWLHIKTLK